VGLAVGTELHVCPAAGQGLLQVRRIRQGCRLARGVLVVGPPLARFKTNASRTGVQHTRAHTGRTGMQLLLQTRTQNARSINAFLMSER
jgi:hypothetical protein